MNHTIIGLLIKLSLSSQNSFNDIFPNVRDRNDLHVLKCSNSGVIVLSHVDHINIEHYQNKNQMVIYDRRQYAKKHYEDTCRRVLSFKHLISNRKWLDIGTGSGGILDELAPYASQTIAVEPNNKLRNCLIKDGYKVYPSVEDVEENDIQVATLFHVFEHLKEPIKTLKLLSRKMTENSILLIEVPHANDILLSLYNLDSFKKFTFWSEHLILHTRESLKKFIQSAGFSDIVIKGCQRYPLANHIHWLAKDNPNGHNEWGFLRNTVLDNAYANMLASLDYTDTLIAIAKLNMEHT